MAADFDQGLLGRLVRDGRGHHLGHLAALYRDTDTDVVTFAGVSMLRRGRRRVVFVPLAGANVEPAAITVQCGRDLARRAPSQQAGRPLPADAEPLLFAHYDLPYTPPRTGTRRLVLDGEST